MALPGYTPSVSSLKCTELGEFEPKTFTCEPNPCKVKAAENALASGCKEGPSAGEATIQSGEECTVQCKDGFYPSDTLLRCHSETCRGALLLMVSHGFCCFRKLNGRSGTKHLWISRGFVTTGRVLGASLRLSPATFTCEAPCSVPTVQNAAAGGICKEAGS